MLSNQKDEIEPGRRINAAFRRAGKPNLLSARQRGGGGDEGGVVGHI